MIEVKIIADSINSLSDRITTMQLKYPRFIHSEFMTHRVFSRNASSSRAIPVAKMIDQVWNDPAMPVHWGQNKSGMQAEQEIQHVMHAKDLWFQASKSAAEFAERMNEIGLHKQVVNRILEPFQWIHVVVTATEWDNFFELRNHPAAQPEIQELAQQMQAAMEQSEPKQLIVGEWHLPYVSDQEVQDFIYTNSFNNAIKCSAARCARVSYMKHDGTKPNVEDDLELYNMLVTRPFTDKRGNVLTDKDPIHASPIEHQATPVDLNSNLIADMTGNFRGWYQYRKIFEHNS